MAFKMLRAGMLIGLLLLGMGSLVLPPASSAKDISNEDRMALLKTFAGEFIDVTPGAGKFPAAFDMGSAEGEATEQPLHKVTIAYKFAMAKYEVPQNLYEAVMGQNPSKWKGPRNSVEMFTWGDAREFCTRLTQLLHEAKLIAPEEEIRLPTEAEWEYCCRAGTKTAYSFGDEATADGDAGNKASLLNAFGWHTGNAAGNDPPVGALKPNPWGFYDMHGYLWEFVADEWHASYRDAPADGNAWTGARAPEQIVLRGGSWKDRFEGLRSASRRPFSSTASDDAVGFRCVKVRRVPAP